ncbi:L-aspartate oxidase [Rhizobium sp. R72]|uniref:L-aspartate oxidase n=1 Tax=unclassified Rhizobium TaxID=2613769 RepID=UPI000B529CD0|nr:MULTISPECIES: L-aspartate oxidase [unclassified Rhizobium]OWW04729.1 L-aspartate oxidase [Rhizobium sp. R72]OWW05786.1 L-aspartate oxidase [Rhizobium sp. R711]
MTEPLDALSGQVVVVGSGLAGLMTALVLAPQPVVLVTRGAIGAQTSSAWAQGGIAACVGDDDSVQSHLSDTLAAGDGLCNAQAAFEIVAEGPAVIAALEHAGVAFDKDSQGRLALGLEAAHSCRRIVHASGDGSGAAIVAALVRAVANTPSITVVDATEVRSLLIHDDRVSGLILSRKGQVAAIMTDRVVLATGGIGGLYDATTNPMSNFGQGLALAARAGARLADMEFVQFHPTGLDSARRPLALVSEAVRGEGATLVNDRGERFMSGIDGRELAPRDVVARAISAELSLGRRVFLDARHALGARFAVRFPTIHALCHEAGIDPAIDLIPVRPAVHYHMGGVATDLTGRSSVPGLWVVGEAASSGLHGANRLASNSLLEAAVLGMRAARDIAATAAGSLRPVPRIQSVCAPDASFVRSIVSRHLGVLRNAGALRGAMAALLPLAESDGPCADPAIVGLTIAVFAMLRKESRGAHARTDFPLALPVAERRFMTLADVLDAAHTHTHSFARSA